MTRTALLIDLNNFARYPTVSIGYIASVLRRSGNQVHVFSPLMVGVRGVVREERRHPFSLLMDKLNYRAATCGSAAVRHFRDSIARRRQSGITIHQSRIVQSFSRELDRVRPDIVLISTYLMYRSACEEICSICQARGVPVVVGGPYFSQREVIEEWVGIPGLTALIAGEVELQLPCILEELLSDGGRTDRAGVIIPVAESIAVGQVAEPLQSLDKVPFPDYSDFPWHSYPNRIAPIITGRGCSWGACAFCSDVTSTMGRTFRTRTPSNVLSEVQEHRRRYDVSQFVFVDLKLNGNVNMWRALASGMQEAAPGSRWIGSVHVGQGENGLCEAQLKEAARAGCVRFSTGLESGSQKLLDSMKKGTKLEAVAAFLEAASAAGISTRCTMIVGYPGETPDDLHASADFLIKYAKAVERVSLNRLSVIPGTVLHRDMKRRVKKYPGFHILSEDARMASVTYRNEASEKKAYRKATMRLITEVHRINSRALSPKAIEFEGVM